ncbi:MAG TPA: hypothetical protein PLT70_06075, partial [bacterium]|nr:hypothetical protein [bacterium]
YVKKTLNKIGYESEMPKTISGKHRSAGYPDLLFKDDLGKINYLECKTFSIENVSTTLRSFYLSPSNDSKITEAAHHFVISFEVYVYKKESDKNIYKIKSWKILTVEKLLVDVKYEFNSDNLRLYSKEHLLAEGII